MVERWQREAGNIDVIEQDESEHHHNFLEEQRALARR